MVHSVPRLYTTTITAKFSFRRHKRILPCFPLLHSVAVVGRLLKISPLSCQEMDENVFTSPNRRLIRMDRLIRATCRCCACWDAATTWFLWGIVALFELHRTASKAAVTVVALFIKSCQNAAPSPPMTDYKNTFATPLARRNESSLSQEEVLSLSKTLFAEHVMQLRSAVHPTSFRHLFAFTISQVSGGGSSSNKTNFFDDEELSKSALAGEKRMIWTGK
jgi:hypothetical protein